MSAENFVRPIWNYFDVIKKDDLGSSQTVTTIKCKICGWMEELIYPTSYTTYCNILPYEGRDQILRDHLLFEHVYCLGEKK